MNVIEVVLKRRQSEFFYYIQQVFNGSSRHECASVLFKV